MAAPAPALQNFKHLAKLFSRVPGAKDELLKHVHDLKKQKEAMDTIYTLNLALSVVRFLDGFGDGEERCYLLD